MKVFFAFGVNALLANLISEERWDLKGFPLSVAVNTRHRPADNSVIFRAYQDI